MNWEIVSIVALVLAGIAAVLTLVNLLVYRRLPARREGELPRISVLIPARDEAANIAGAMEAVLASRGVELELIVLDDHSTDGTAEIVRESAARDPRVRLESAPPLPEGWCGKQHACHVLAGLAEFPLLVFTDADVRLEPDALARMAAAMEGPDAPALASGFPRQELGSFGEMLLLPLIHFVLLAYLPMHFMKWTRMAAFSAGCGQLFIARREAYQESGGHAMIRTSLHDGVKLPRLFRKAGFRTALFDATDLARCRMYHSSRETWDGLGKNATEGIAAPGTIVPMTALLAGGQVLPVLLLAASPWLADSVLPISAAACFLAWLPRLVTMKRFHHPAASVLLHPLGVVVLLAIQWIALFRRCAGRPSRWKSRDYSAAGTALALMLVQALEAAEPAKAPARIELPDQYDKVHVLSFPAKKVTVLSIADRHGREQSNLWVPALAPYKDRTVIQGLADAKGTPGFMKSSIRKRIKAAHRTSLLIDWTGATCAAIGYRPKLANLLILDRSGKILHRSHGAPAPETVAAFTKALDAAIAAER